MWNRFVCMDHNVCQTLIAGKEGPPHDAMKKLLQSEDVDERKIVMCII